MKNREWFVTYAVSDSAYYMVNPRTDVVRVEAPNEIAALDEAWKMFRYMYKGWQFIIREVLTRKEWEEKCAGWPERLRRGK